MPIELPSLFGKQRDRAIDDYNAKMLKDASAYRGFTGIDAQPDRVFERSRKPDPPQTLDSITRIPQQRTPRMATPVQQRPKQMEAAMPQEQVRAMMVSQGQMPTMDPQRQFKDQMFAQFNAQADKAMNLATGRYSPSQDALREWMKQMAIQARSRGLSQQATSSGKGNQRTAEGAIPALMTNQMAGMGAQDRLSGINMLQQVLSGQSQLNAGLGDLAQQQQAFSDWYRQQGAALQAGEAYQQMQNNADMYNRQIQFAQGMLPSMASGAGLLNNQYINQMQNTQNAIAGLGNAAQYGLGAWMQASQPSQQVMNNQAQQSMALLNPQLRYMYGM